jgi:hypothetical protein
MSTTPLKRIYFDTNSIYRWPNPSRQVFQIFELARWLKAEIYFPKVVEDELEAQFVRNIAELLAAITSKIKDLKTICWNIINVGIDEPSVEEAGLRKDFQTRSQQLKDHFGISTLPLAAIDLPILIDMAINRHLPFEERTVGKDKVVTGLQDAAIVFSVIDHVRGFPKNERCAFVSADDVFHKADMRKLFEHYDVNIELFKNTNSLFDDLWDHIWGEVKEGLNREAAQISELLENTKDNIAQQIQSLLKPTDISAGLFNQVVHINTVNIDRFGPAYPDIPPSENHPPTAPYGRPEGAEVKISASAIVDVHATVETQTYSFFNSMFSDELSLEPPPPPTPPKISTRKLSARLTLTLVGIAHNNVIEDLRVLEVTVDK